MKAKQTTMENTNRNYANGAYGPGLSTDLDAEKHPCIERVGNVHLDIGMIRNEPGSGVLHDINFLCNATQDEFSLHKMLEGSPRQTPYTVTHQSEGGSNLQEHRGEVVTYKEISQERLPTNNIAHWLKETKEDACNPLINEQQKPKRRKCVNIFETELPIGFEAVLMELGSPGRFFWLQFALHTLATFCLSNTVLIYVFTGYEPTHSCKHVANESELLSQYGLLNSSTATVYYGRCNITVVNNNSGVDETVATLGCMEGHDYMGRKHISFVAEWDMVCNNAGLKELVQTIMLVGQTAGGIIFTSIADRFGRKPVLVISNLLLCAAGLGAAFSPNIFVLIAFRFLSGLFQQGASLVGYTTVMELVTAKYRRLAGVLMGMMWTSSVLVLAFVAYLMRDESWRTVQMVAALFACNALLYPFFLCESPRWLSANSKFDQALKIVKKACRTNGKDYSKVKAVFDFHVVHANAGIKQEKVLVNNSEPKVERYSLLDIARHRTLLVSALIMWFIWITNSTTYYGLFLTSSSLAGNRHLNFFLLGLADLPSDVVNIFLFAFFGRKPVMMGWMMVAGSGLFTATLLTALGTTPLTKILSTVFFLIGKIGIGASFNGIFMYTPELFPTNLRSAGLGICSSVSRLGGMIAPYSQALADVILWGPGTIFSAMCFISTLLFITLPETRGQPMPNTIREMKLRATGRSGHDKSQNAGFEIEVTAPTETVGL